MYLNCHSFFSLNYGVLSPENLVLEAKKRGVCSLALTDINNTSAVFDFINYCRKAEIHPVVGVEVRNEFQLCYIALAKNRLGFTNLNRWLSTFFHDKTSFPSEAPKLEELEWIYPSANLPNRAPKENEWLGITPDELGRWLFKSSYQSKDKENILTHWLHKTVAWQAVTFLDKAGFSLHRLLRCIDQNTILSKLHISTHARLNEIFPTLSEMEAFYKEAPQMLERATALLLSCQFEMDLKSAKNKKTYSADREDDLQLLRKLAFDGIIYRYGPNNKLAKKRVESELAIIAQMEFSAYFLITWDIINYAKNRGYYHVGRGSGANSIVAFCLRITDVDPIELDLYFERFINPSRTSPPDFDIDFSWDERKEVQDYIFKRYGREHVAMMGAYVTYQGDSISRELGKVFGLPKEEIDKMVSAPSLFQDTYIMHLIKRYGAMMKDMPNFVSVHAGGILIAEESIYSFTALNYPPLGFAVTQFDMYVAEEIGFAKFDILSQRGLGHIKEAVNIIYQNKGLHVDVHDVKRFKKDPIIKNQIESSETIGCFYIESPAMRQLMTKLRCNNYLTLVAASSIIRPGVSKSGMMKQYIQRFHNPNSFDYIHPVMKTLLEETYGVMIYQEDVIKVAHHFAGLDLAEADVLRRAMSGKFRSRSEFDKIRERYFSNCKERGYTDEISMEVWRQIESFSGYSFSKAHSASFAVESYQSLFLKTYYPMEFMVAVINNEGGFYNREIYVHEARRSGAKVLPPCINNSERLATIKGDVIYLGLGHIKTLEADTVAMILEERKNKGRFQNLDKFVKRVNVSLEQAITLIRAGAFNFINLSKKNLLWDAQFHFNGLVKRRTVSNIDLFEEEDRDFALPDFTDIELETSYDEMELLGFALCSPFYLVDWSNVDFAQQKNLALPAAVSATQTEGWQPAQQALALKPDIEKDLPGNLILSNSHSVRQLKTYKGKFLTLYGALITTKGVRTVKGDMMSFGTFLDHEGQFLDTVHFSASLQKYPFIGLGVYQLKGYVVEEFGLMSLDVKEMHKLPRKGDPRSFKF